MGTQHAQRRSCYPSDLTDAEWVVVARHLPRRRRCRGGRPRVHARRAVLDAVFYVVRTGCQWRQLPRDFPPWQTVYGYFRDWRHDGTWVRLCDALRARVRVRAGRDPQPAAGVVDTQSVKTTGVGGPRSWDGHKRIKGRKRHILVDAQGLLLRVVVHEAALNDGTALPQLLTGAPAAFPRLRHLWADRGYAGKAKAWVERELGWTVELATSRAGGGTGGAGPEHRGGWVPGWTADRVHAGLVRRSEWIWVPPRPPVPLEPWASSHLRPRRWVVERTFAWLGQARRLSKDYERSPRTSAALIYCAALRLCLRRLARS